MPTQMTAAPSQQMLPFRPVFGPTGEVGAVLYGQSGFGVPQRMVMAYENRQDEKLLATTNLPIPITGRQLRAYEMQQHMIHPGRAGGFDTTFSQCRMIQFTKMFLKMKQASRQQNSTSVYPTIRIIPTPYPKSRKWIVLKKPFTQLSILHPRASVPAQNKRSIAGQTYMMRKTALQALIFWTQDLQREGRKRAQQTQRKVMIRSGISKLPKALPFSLALIATTMAEMMIYSAQKRQSLQKLSPKIVSSTSMAKRTKTSVTIVPILSPLASYRLTIWQVKTISALFHKTQEQMRLIATPAAEFGPFEKLVNMEVESTYATASVKLDTLKAFEQQQDACVPTAQQSMAHMAMLIPMAKMKTHRWMKQFDFEGASSPSFSFAGYSWYFAGVQAGWFGSVGCVYRCISISAGVAPCPFIFNYIINGSSLVQQNDNPRRVKVSRFNSPFPSKLFHGHLESSCSVLCVSSCLLKLFVELMSLVKKILVANRGEIACRIIRTAKRLGVETVAIYSDIDRNSKFVDMADKAYRVGGNPSSESYLNRTKILEIAKDSHCEALHPGFGFLSENAGFAQECVNNGIKFIGPPPSAITSMGSKSESKKIMTAANVPVVPGYHGEDQNPQYLFEQANRMEYPVLIKAVSGGGGKGMRIVRKKEDFLQALQSCKREALKAFSDDRVLVQKYITKPRHIEIQVFGDQHGNYVHLYQRDCSIQRRHQKVVEEAPSNVADNIRNMICNSAVEAARAVGYYNAGTVEFIFDLDSNKHYFMEMNTRLQVEHPISEMITGYDFVQWQLLVASGFPLPKKQREINKKGNAIEVRIYAQDPFNGFLPGNGKLKYLREPVENKVVRIETGVRDKDVISTYYDPMIAKLITYGATREEAIELMRQALKDYRVVGLNNNLKFLKRVFDNAVFRQGDYDTGFIEQNITSLLSKDQPVDLFDLVTAVAARNVANGEKLGLPADLVDYKNVRGQKQLQRIVVNETSLAKQLKWEVEVERKNLNKGSVVLDGKDYQYQILERRGNVLKLVINGQTRKQEYFMDRNTVHVFDQSGDQLGFRFQSDELRAVEQEGATDRFCKSPMPGTVTKLYKKTGDVAKKGESIVAMQAMKMELVIKAQFDCKIVKLNVADGDFVEAGKPLVELEHV